MTNQQREWLDFAKSVAREAGDIMQEYFGKKPDAHLKVDNTIVTIADEEINQLVIKRVAERYPAHDIDGEEASARRGSDYVWVCDPIDGTAPFAMELPVSVFSLALVIDGQPEVGVIYAPFSDHLYWAVHGQGAFMNSKQIYVNKKTFGGMTGMNVDWWPSAEWDVMRVIHTLAYEKGAYVTAPGSATHAAALVARGEFAASVFAGTKGKNVDIAAAKVIVEEAGGKVTDLFGREQRYDQDICGAVLSNGVVHEEIVEAMRKLEEKNIGGDTMTKIKQFRDPQLVTDGSVVGFYPREFYVFDTFASFQVDWRGRRWPTSEHAYQAAHFFDTAPELAEQIFQARSAHEAYKIAKANADKAPQNWDEIKVGIMEEIVRAKCEQNPYVKQKLLETLDEEIVEDSPKDAFWGWGENRDGHNELGKIWMRLRNELNSETYEMNTNQGGNQ